MINWWTRKPLIVGRAIILTSTLKEIKDVIPFLSLGKEKRAYNYKPNIKQYQKKCDFELENVKILDPFGGSGNLIIPTMELGFNVTSRDYNPLAHIIQRASLECPYTYTGNLSSDVQ